MTAAATPQPQPPEAELQFDVGSTDDSLERMIELFARHGDTYRVYVPARSPITATTPRASASIASGSCSARAS